MIKPHRLIQGDTIGVIAPASPPNQENLQRGLAFIDQLGLTYKLGKSVYAEYGYLAGKDEDRLADFHEMFLDRSVQGIFCAGGGYGTARIASGIDYEVVKRNPKIFWGYSDLTFLHTAIIQKAGLITFHGPMLASDIGKVNPSQISLDGFDQLFYPNDVIYSETISTLETIVPGKAEGQIIGGNLSLLSSTMGTPFEIDTKNRILLIEEINEEPRIVDRMMNQLLMAGKLQSAAGIVVGDFNNCISETNATLTLEEILCHYLGLANQPALKGFKIGHCSPNISIPLGSFAKMDTFNKTLLIESGIQ